MQNDFSEIYTKLDQKNLWERIITSPVANLITLRISEAIGILIVHEQRHLNQAKAVMENNGFPAK